MHISIEGWEDGQLVKGDLDGVDRAQTQAADLVTVTLSSRHTSASSITLKQNPRALLQHGSGSAVRVGCCVWDGAYVLSAWLDAQPPGTFAGKRCIELGAGLGLVGLVLARLGARVVLTDTPAMLVQARMSAARNKLAASTAAHLRAPGQGSADTAALDFEAPDAAAAVAALATPPVDWVVATDCVYPDPNGTGRAPQAAMLMQAAAGLCHASTRVLMTFEPRSAELQRQFLEAAHAAFGSVAALPPEQLPPPFRVPHVKVYEMQC